MKKAALLFGLVISLALVGFGQRTVTNSTLERFQQKRLAAERDYRENYARMGFPSPEELDRQRDADLKARLQLADQLRTARLKKERLELERRSLDLEAVRIDNEFYDRDAARFYGGGYNGGVYNGGGYNGGYNGGYYGGGYNGGYYGGGYYGGGYYGGSGGYGYGGFGNGPRHHGFGFPSGPLSVPRNQLLPFIDRREGYRVTPFEVIPVPSPQSPILIFRGGRPH